MLIPTMAVKLTEKTYPFAIACLPAGILKVDLKNIMGCYLVINDQEVETTMLEDRRVMTQTLTNRWMTEEVFRSAYEFVTDELKDQFVEIREI